MPRFEPQVPVKPEPDAEGVIVATLGMFSCALGSGSPCHVPQIAANLQWLAEQPELGASLRHTCASLARHWAAVSAEIRKDSVQSQPDSAYEVLRTISH